MPKALAGETELISRNTYTGQAAGSSALRGADTISADGRYVVFQALTYALVPGDTNRSGDIFVRDRWLSTTRRVSVASDGTQSNGYSDAPAISADGRYVVFQSDASNLVSGSGESKAHAIYLHDTVTGQTELVSAAFNGGFADQGSYEPSVSGNGRYVAFMSTASNLIEGYVGVQRSIYVRDRQAGRTELINEGWAYSVAISADGRYVAFDTDAAGTSSPNVYVRDRTTGVRDLISVTPSGTAGIYGGRNPSISADGRYVAFGSRSFDLVSDDSNGTEDIFVRDRQLRSTSRISLDSSGQQLARGADSGQFGPAISADGRFVTFVSNDPFAVPDDTNGTYDGFVRDTLLQRTLRATVSSTGQQGYSLKPITCAISGDGRFVAFDSYSSGLVVNDSNFSEDVFVHDFGSPSSTFALKPNAVAFGSQALFTSTTLSFWLTNMGTSALSITSVGLVGIDPGMFSTNNRCGSSVAVGASCSIRVTFRPTSVGEKSAKLRVVAGDNDVRTQSLAGTGVVSVFAVSPTSLDFGSVPIGTTTAAKVVTISNTGSAALPISAISLAGWNPYQFAQTANCPATLAVGAKCTVNIVFKPTATGSKAALVNITPGGGAAMRSVTLIGAARR